MVSKWRVHKRFSFSVRMKRSATPLPSGWRTKDGEASDAEEGDLALEVVGHVVRSVVVPEHEAGGHVLADGTEVPAHTLADRFRAWKRLALLSAWMPTHSLLQ